MDLINFLRNLRYVSNYNVTIILQKRILCLEYFCLTHILYYNT